MALLKTKKEVYAAAFLTKSKIVDLCHVVLTKVFGLLPYKPAIHCFFFKVLMTLHTYEYHTLSISDMYLSAKFCNKHKMVSMSSTVETKNICMDPPPKKKNNGNT